MEEPITLQLGIPLDISLASKHSSLVAQLHFAWIVVMYFLILIENQQFSSRDDGMQFFNCFATKILLNKIYDRPTP